MNPWAGARQSRLPAGVIKSTESLAFQLGGVSAHDGVHLHARPGVTIAATYQLDAPGTYPLLCAIPGHTEGGMIGELVVLAGHGSAHSDP